MLYDLRHADARLKWLVTCLLATFGLAYLFGGWMVSLYAGFTPHAVAVTYASPEDAMTMPMPPSSTTMVEHTMTAQQMGAEEPHTVNRELLVQDTHVHVPMYGVIAALLGLVVLGLDLKRAWGYALITLLFAAPWLDFLGMWTTKFVSAQLAIVTLAGGYLMGLNYTVVTGLALWQMWRPAQGDVR